MATQTNPITELFDATLADKLTDAQLAQLAQWAAEAKPATLDDVEAELWSALEDAGFRHDCDLVTEKPELTAILFHMQEELEKGIETARAIGRLMAESASELNYRAIEAQLDALETAACWVRVLDKLRRVLAARERGGEA